MLRSTWLESTCHIGEDNLISSYGNTVTAENVIDDLKIVIEPLPQAFEAYNHNRPGDPRKGRADWNWKVREQDIAVAIGDGKLICQGRRRDFGGCSEGFGGLEGVESQHGPLTTHLKRVDGSTLLTSIKHMIYSHHHESNLGLAILGGPEFRIREV
ncbi:uncharacterized protein RSE6_06336 [Rhynchosporium secalis]|uniref:Uncharacterized protein n=1 Tax=Rhynchosporium secalis TaxID=38038 RepID=A0A1E1MA35_RHYSE|nr:uncharacterized protein RSE6_06336 [Rhynchosporium secalis]